MIQTRMNASSWRSVLPDSLKRRVTELCDDGVGLEGGILLTGVIRFKSNDVGRAYGLIN
jgi:hypothetical protein